MSTIIIVLAFVLALFVLAPACVVALETIGALLPAKKNTRQATVNARAAIIVPAHNEGAYLAPTLMDISSQMSEGDRLIVVADNCDDDTAEVAIASGAECLVRNDLKNRGKGFALQFALDHLHENHPDAVVFIDADCRLLEGALENLISAVGDTQGPVQSLYLMRAGEGAEARQRVAEFAWLFMNAVRMRGLDRLAGVTRLTGSGMALPWHVAHSVKLGSGQIVEDLALTLDLVASGASPRLVKDAVVTSEFPDSADASVTQRARWEQGSLKLGARRAIPLLFEGLAGGRFRLCAIALDLLTPPLVLLTVLILLSLTVSLVAALLGSAAPLWFSLTAFLLISLSVFTAWLKFGREALPPSEMAGVVRFLLEKTRIYGSAGRQSTKGWTRTERK